MRKDANLRAAILIVHDTVSVGRYLEGVLRNGFRVRLATDCRAAVESMMACPPDVVLCAHTCLNIGSGELLSALTNGSCLPQIPLIVVTGDRPEEDTEMLKLVLGAVDYVPRSINPRLLRWKVMNWIHLKREVDRLRHQSRPRRNQPSAAKSELRGHGSGDA